MKKILKPLLLILLITLTACNTTTPPGTTDDPGVIPTHDFTVNNYLQDNAVFLQKEEFVISGISEKDVLIKLEIYDDKDTIVNTASDMADKNGEFEIKVVAPEASFREYKIVLTDSVHTHTFENILFGEVWIIAGEQIKESFEEEPDYINEYVRIFSYDSEGYNWSIYNENNSVYNYAYYIADELQKEVKHPVAVVDATLEYGNADCWLSHDAATNQLKIQKYLKSINRYTVSNENVILKTNTLSSMYKTFTNQLTNFGIRGVIWQQGKADFALNDNLDSFRLISDFAYLTSNVFLEYMNLFEDLDIYSIQYGKIDIELSNALRSAQLQSTYLVNNVEIIPTYDCHILENEESEEYIFSSEKYVDRIVSNVVNNSYQKKDGNRFSLFTNVVINNDKIILTFSDNIELVEVEEIYGLFVYNDEMEKLEYTFEIVDNKIIINLVEPIILDESELTISYAENEDLYKCNLYNKYENPVLPFRFEISN